MRATDKISTAVEECLAVATDSTEAKSPFARVSRFIHNLHDAGDWTTDEIIELWKRVMRAMAASHPREEEFFDPPINITSPVHKLTPNEVAQLVKPGDKIATATGRRFVVSAVHLVDGGWWLEPRKGGMWIPIQQVACVNGRKVTQS